jgi:hypothetical protein
MAVAAVISMINHGRGCAAGRTGVRLASGAAVRQRSGVRCIHRVPRPTADPVDLYASPVAELERRQEFRKPIRPNDHAVAWRDLGVEAGQGGPYGRPNSSLDDDPDTKPSHRGPFIRRSVVALQ